MKKFWINQFSKWIKNNNLLILKQFNILYLEINKNFLKISLIKKNKWDKENNLLKNKEENQ